MAGDSPVTATDEGVIVAIRVTPKAGRQGIDGIIADAAGRPVVKISVTATPEDGKANKAVIALLSRVWNIPKSAISVQSGQKSRNKILRITGDTPTLELRIEKTLGTPHHA